MNLEKAIHQRWAATPALEANLPAANVKTGLARGAAVPYASLVRKACRPVLRTNSGDAIDEATVEVHLWHDDYDAGRAALEQVQAAFDRSHFSVSAGDRVLQMLRTNDSATQHSDGLWQFVIEFRVQVHSQP